MSKKVLVTGGAGYIGSHTVVALTEAGYLPIIVDDFSNSNPDVIDKLKDITKTDIINYEVDILTFDIDWIESAYCDINGNWLIYISHEGTITFAGQELLTSIEKEYPPKMVHIAYQV